MQKNRLNKSWQILLTLFLLVAALYFLRPLIVPLCFALLFTLLFMPLCRWLERKGIPRPVAILICIILFLLLIAGMVGIITWQVTDLAADLGNIQAKLSDFLDDIKNYISQNFGISKTKQEDIIKSGTTSSWISTLGKAFMNTFLDFVLIVVYVFMLMYYRNHFKKFLLKIIPHREGRNAQDALDTIEKVSQRYIIGMGMMIASLWVMYGIGFSIIGLKNALFFAVLCGLFEIVPFVGNLTGNILAATMAITQGGGTPLVVGVLVTYSSIQFIQSYLLQPLVVGGEVNINPFFSIFGLIAGEMLWGIAGMVLVLPLLAILKIVCDHVEDLKPYGFLLGNPPKTQSKISKKVTDWAEKKKRKKKKI